MLQADFKGRVIILLLSMPLLRFLVLSSHHIVLLVADNLYGKLRIQNNLQKCCLSDSVKFPVVRWVFPVLTAFVQGLVASQTFPVK